MRDDIISMYIRPPCDLQRISRHGDNEGAGPPWRRLALLLEGSSPPASTWMRIHDEIIYLRIYEPQRRIIKCICLIVYALLHLDTREGCVSIHTYAVLVRIEDSPVCGYVFVGGRCADHVSNPLYETSSLRLGFPTV